MIGARLRMASAALIAAATLVGTIVDDAPARPPVTRAGWRVLEVDLHAHTVVFDHQGRAYGDEAMIAALAAVPYAMRAQDYEYRGNGRLDRLARTLGFVGLVGLLAFGRRRRKS